MKLLIGKVKKLDKIYRIKIKGRFGKAVTGAKKLKPDIPDCQKAKQLAKKIDKMNTRKYREQIHHAEVGNKVDVQLKFKEGWSDAQKVEATQKCKALSEAKTVKTAPKRSSTSASSRYKKANGENSVPKGNDVDHTIDLQLGGADDILNMNPLDSSVNRM